jgi:hypothetical protein
MAVYIPTTFLVGEPIHLSAKERRQIESRVEFLISVLDAADGDIDVGPDGDELDGSFGEDDFVDVKSLGIWAGPGCPIADADTGVDDVGEQTNEDGSDEMLAQRPKYGIDQSLGPINEISAHHAHMRALAA